MVSEFRFFKKKKMKNSKLCLPVFQTSCHPFSCMLLLFHMFSTLMSFRSQIEVKLKVKTHYHTHSCQRYRFWWDSTDNLPPALPQKASAPTSDHQQTYTTLYGILARSRCKLIFADMTQLVYTCPRDVSLYM